MHLLSYVVNEVPSRTAHYKYTQSIRVNAIKRLLDLVDVHDVCDNTLI